MSLDLFDNVEAYAAFLNDLKSRIQTAQTRAALAVNHELVLLYWQMGRDITEKMRLHGWGAKTVDRLAADLKKAFPGVQGFSARNLRYMRSFADAWPDEAILQAPLAKLTWYHNIALIEKLPDREIRLWYAKKALEHGWSRNVLVHQIESQLHTRQGKAITNFADTLPSPQSDLAQQVLKDPYNFDFLMLHDEAVERDMEHGLLRCLRDFLLELGAGFAFVGSQYHLDIGDQDFYIDLLFYHTRLHCYVVIDLKMRDFLPEDAGKMSFYLAAADDLLRTPGDAQTIGILSLQD
jgi:predicted nuclease of restriction endonuclease-like (RecB) superfamily